MPVLRLITSIRRPRCTTPGSSCTPITVPENFLPWVDGLLEEGEAFYKVHGIPLFSSHMIDLSEEPLQDNIETCKRYLERMSEMEMTLEIELGITGGEEDGVDHSEVDNSRLYTQPEEVAYAFEELMKVSDRFTIAAAFGNVHGLYRPGNVRLRLQNTFGLPEIRPGSIRDGR